MKDPENLTLLVNILNKYMYFHMSDSTLIPETDVKKLVDLINENIGQIKADGKVDKVKKAIGYFENTVNALKFSEINIH